MTEASHYMVPISSRPRAEVPLGYRFVDNNVVAVGETNIYMDFNEPADLNRPTARQSEQLSEPTPSPPTKQPVEPQEDNFKFKWILIVVAVAFLINLSVAACGLWMAMQGDNRITGVLNELNDELDAEVKERRTIVEALKNDTAAQVENINERVENQQDIKEKLEAHEQRMNRTDEHYAAFQSDIKEELKAHEMRRNRTDKNNAALQNEITLVREENHNLAKKINFTFHQELGVLGKNIDDIENQMLRLVNGNSTSGRVEIFHDGIWGTICNKNYDRQAVHLMCRLLGFNGGALIYYAAYFGQGSGQIWLDIISCSGNETTLEECIHRGWGVYDCDHSNDLSIVCKY